MVLSLGELVNQAREELVKLTGLELSSTVRTVKQDGNWKVSVELVEKRSLPDGMDILATYDVLMDEDGNILEFGRRRLRKRIDTDQEED